MSLLDSVRSGPNFDNVALRLLPVDKSGSGGTRIVRDACFALVRPTPIELPQLIVASEEVFELLDLPVELAQSKCQYSEARSVLTHRLAGNEIWPGSEPAAHCYCGHQFGQFAGQLGDGAAIYLGEVLNRHGERWELQLKGAGLTPFSRQADGRKVLRSSLREFLCSEAMHHLGIPTTRAASVVSSNTWVERDVFYTGNVIQERASVTARVAPSFIRFGSFEITKPQDPFTGRFGPSIGNKTIVCQLADYVIKQFFPNIWMERVGTQLTTNYLRFFEQVVLRTAELVACWQTVGFCHGVLNTDNMSILGLTIDYGPFGFMERFMWDHVCNASDTDGRYSYSQQPSVCVWNCARLAECLARGLVDKEANDNSNMSTELKQARYLELLDGFRTVIEDKFNTHFKQSYLTRMRKKLGLINEAESDDVLFKQLFDAMEQTGADFTNTFVALQETVRAAFANQSNPALLDPSRLVRECCDVDELRQAYESPNNQDRALFTHFARIDRRVLDRVDEHKVLKAEQREARFRQLEHMSNAEKSQHDAMLWQSWLDLYLARFKLDIKMVPSNDGWLDRVCIMEQSNPRVVLRNYLAEQAIRAVTERDDNSLAYELLQALRNPFRPPKIVASDDDCNPSEFHSILMGQSHPPAWARKLRIT